MIFENNYAWAGCTAIIYNLELDYPELNFYINEKNKIFLNHASLIEIGIEYKKSSDDQWNSIIIANNTILNNARNGKDLKDLISNVETTNHIINKPEAFYKWNFIIPIRIVIKNLEPNTTYDIRSYYLSSAIDIKIIFNQSEATTLERKDIMYNCTEVTGGTDEKNEKLKTTINTACDIYNAMTAFSTSTAPYDSLGSKKGGSFTARIKDLGSGVAADSGMNFSSKVSQTSVSTVCHEMAHNLMQKSDMDETFNDDAYNKIVKFMEFATHAPKATWRWNNKHNYPVISSASYSGVYNYLVAAACWVCRDASNLI